VAASGSTVLDAPERDAEDPVDGARIELAIVTATIGI